MILHRAYTLPLTKRLSTPPKVKNDLKLLLLSSNVVKHILKTLFLIKPYSFMLSRMVG